MTFPCLTTSWDDGHPLDFRVADLLSKYGLTGTFYIPRQCQTPTMSEEQVRELATSFGPISYTLTASEGRQVRDLANVLRMEEATTGMAAADNARRL
jgi:hypothetical protein